MILSNTTTIVATILLAFSSSALCSAAELSSSSSSNFLRGKTRQLSTCKMYKGPTPCFDKRSWCARLGRQYVTCATITSQQCTLFHRSTHPCPEKCGLIPSQCSNFQQSSNQAPQRNRLPLRRPVLPQGSSNFPNEPVNNNNGNNSDNNSSNSNNNSNNNSSNSNSLATRAPTGPPTTPTNNNSNNSDDSNNSSSNNNNNSSSSNNNNSPAPTPGPTPSSNSNNDSSSNSSNNNNAPTFAPSPAPSPQPTTCADEPESTKFGYRLDEGSERNNKSCKTVAAKNWRKKCQEIATLKKGGKQLPISQLCPRTCRTCPDQCEAGYISCAPTNAPTTPAPSSTPTLSSKPSLGGNTQSPPSNLPTLAPSVSAYPTVSKGPTTVSNEIEI